MMSLRLVLVDAVDRILSVALEDTAGSSDSPLSSWSNTNLGVIPLVTGVHDLTAADLC